MDTFRQKDFSKLLKKNATALRHDLLPLGTDVMRIYDRNMEEFPITVDLYADYARVVDYGIEALSYEDREICIDIINRFAYVDKDKIVYCYRSKREKGQQHEKSETAPVIVNVKENNLVFRTDLTTYADTGLFLDHCKTRQMIKEKSAGMDVLNLFSYTGSFSVYAASGLAKSVTSVDLSSTYTKWAEENLKTNGFEGEMYRCICQDALEFVRNQLNIGSKYDIVIFDPPSFSNSHKMESDFDVQRDFVFWIKNLVTLLRKGGFILFSTNLGSFRMDRRRLRGLSVKEVTDQLRADGFCKGRKGTVRSFLMAVEDDSLSLDWSEDKRPSDVKKDFDGGHKGGRRESQRRERHDYGDRKPRFSDESHESRGPRESWNVSGNSEFRPRRRFDDERPRRRFDDERPRRRFDDERPRRRFDDERPGRRFDDERPRRRFDDERPGRRFDDERPRRRFDDERPRRRFDDERPRRRFDDERPRRRFDDERPRRRFDDERRAPREKSEYKRPANASSFRDKPYGFDSFRPARNRNDSSDFFWNSEDIKKTDKN